MTVFNGFVGTARRLDDIDLPRMGHEIGVGRLGGGIARAVRAGRKLRGS
ncbi:MAG TPA: hypothetical protein VGO22_07085 [Pseudorhizobium sp.]|jgi:hypothetical protein|nr:hypothetical protein [Pseudorhizobium sp.]